MVADCTFPVMLLKALVALAEWPIYIGSTETEPYGLAALHSCYMLSAHRYSAFSDQSLVS